MTKENREKKEKYTWTSGASYEGEWKNEQMDGIGRYIWSNGDIYEGEFKNDEINGKGKCMYANGDYYEGDWKNDKKNGKGKYFWKNGDIFVGEWKDDKREGEGKLVTVNGNIYIGEWKNDELNGKGKIIEEDGTIYEGNLRDGEANGNGRLTRPNGCYYEGEFKNGLMDGRGKILLTDGTIYEGEFKNSVKDGIGKLICGDRMIIEGEFKNDKLDGKCKVTFKNGEIYEGEWKNDGINGKGKITYPNGSYYEGELKEGLKEGNGRELFDDGSIYEGEWKNNLREGVGKLIFEDGVVFEGNFKNDVIDGKCKIIYKNGNYAECNLKNGKLNGKCKFWSQEEGAYYEGNLKNNKIDGEVKLVAKNENTYEDEKKNEKNKFQKEDDNINETKEENYKNEKNEENYEKEISNNKVEDTEKDINMPGIPMTEKKRNIMLLGYADAEFSNKEEENFYKNENISYFARMDTDIKYNNKMYYKKFYISKEEFSEKKEQGIYNSFGVYISPAELRNMGREGFITVKEVKKSILKEYDDGTIIIFWQSPIADLYYDKEKNEKKINDYVYNTMLKREFTFEPLKYYNTYIAGNELFKDGTVDNFLIKILLDKKDSNELTDIIYTIQSNQNKIIRTDAKENFIVQGCAGSGKTMILLHRLSYLKFNDLLPSYDEIKIITPNQLFNNFIKNLTKDLNIEQIEQITIENYYLKLNNLYIERYNKIDEIDEKFYRKHKNSFKQKFNIENLFNERENGKILDIYSHDMLNMIKQEYNNLINFYNQKIKENNFEIENTYFSNQIYYEQIIKKITKEISGLNIDFKNISEICKNKEDKIKNLEDELVKLLKENINNNLTINKIQNECKELEKEKEEELKKKKLFFENTRKNSKISKCEKMLNIKYTEIQNIKLEQSKIIEKQGTKTKEKQELTQQLKEYNNKKEKLKTNINKHQQLKETILDNTYFILDIYNNIMVKIREKYSFLEEKNEYSKINLIILLYINYLHIGELTNNDKLLCIDEAQDYSEIEYEIIKNVNKDVVINLYGDINQSIYKNGIYKWDNLINNLNLNMYVLNENYRNPSEITNYCNEKFGYDILSMGLSIKSVETIKKGQMYKIINKKIKENKKVAIISKEDFNDKIEENELISYCNIQSAKGIEYNTVIVYDKDMNDNEKYIAYTRALSELYILED